MNAKAVLKPNANRQILLRHRAAKGFTPSFVLAFISMVFVGVHEFTENIFAEFFSPVNYAFTIAALAAIIFYQLYILLGFRYYKYKYLLTIGLLGILYFALLYLFLFSGLTRALLLCSMLLNLLIYKQYKLTDSEKKKLYWIFVGLVIVMLINGPIRGASYDNKVNPNTCGLLLMLLFCMSVVKYRNSKKVSDFAIALACFGLQFLYHSRTATLGCVCFIIFTFILCGKKKFFSSKSAALFILLLSVISVLFAYWYTEYYYGGAGAGNDLLTGRQYIWDLAFKSIRENPWFGVGSDFNAELAATNNNLALINAHNQSLGLLTSFGVIAFVIFNLVFAYLVPRSCEIKTNRKKKLTYRLPIIFIVCILIMNFAEANFFYSWSMVIMVAYCFICNNCEKSVRLRYEPMVA